MSGSGARRSGPGRGRIVRWFILVLIAANVGLYLWFSTNEPENVRSVDEGRLPRVSEIELIGQEGAQGFPSMAEKRSEPDGETELQVAESAPSAVTEPEPEPRPESGPPEQCFGVGWFEEESHAEAYQRQIERREAGVEFRGVTQRQESLEPFHWVIIPPLESREAALARYRELVELGIEAYVVPSGDRENAISLGLFRSRGSAEGVLQSRQQQNIDAILVKFPRNRISYALVFEGVPPESFDEIDDASGQSEVGLQLIEFSACEGVATAEKNP